MWIKALAVIALIIVIPATSQAVTLTNSFLSSSSGTSYIALDDSIKFEVHIGDMYGDSYHGPR